MMREHFATALDFFDKRLAYIAGAYAVFVAGVIAVASVLAGRGALSFIDHPFLAYATAMHSDTLTQIMLVVTAFGGGMVITGLIIASVVWLLYRGMGTHASALLTSVGGAACVAMIMKRVLERPRPSGFFALQESTFSFPSGHAAMSLAFFGILVYFLLRHTQRLSVKICAVIAGVAVIGAIGISRIYLGVHWPSDVVGSYVLVGAWLAIVIRHMERKYKEA